MDELQNFGVCMKNYTVRSGIIFTKRGFKPITKESIISTLLLQGISKEEAEKSIREWIESETKKEEEIAVIKSEHTPQSVVTEILLSENIIYDESDGLYYQAMDNGKKLAVKGSNLDNIIITRADNHQVKLAHMGIKPFARDVLIAATADLRFSSEQKIKCEIMDRVTFDIRYEKEADSILDEIIDIWKIENKELTKTILKHWIWLVKRRIIGKQASWDTIPIFYSCQGTGKTTLVNEIRKVLGRLGTKCLGTELVDITREIGKLDGCYVLFLDEIEVDSKQIAAFKSLITTDTIKVRKFHSQDQMDCKLTFVPIGTSNYKICDVIDDPTGLRRFYQVNIGITQKDMTDALLARMNKLYERLPLLWKSIDENKEEGYLMSGTLMFSQLFEIQKTYKKQTSLDLYLNEQGYIPEKLHEKVNLWIEQKIFYTNYKIWCKDEGGYQFQMIKDNVGNRLKEITAYKKPKNRYTYGFRVEEDEKCNQCNGIKPLEVQEYKIMEAIV